ncbi:hypothetical protein SI65_04391 [Aspergillus cristatus]|uniref:FAD-binding PCMH-type domain-containing protein n=1 Tax=Aspergillus cristatus TaxID=573508 RepID=A0A1E3BEQ7_ASPCR|nr:hypothetical protein SI65_04391 [Aspergillus cristatus]
MWPPYEGRTCLPIAADEILCTLGGYPSYVVNVSTVAQIQLAVNFARENGLRLVVKNTGHDYRGKSVGAGAFDGGWVQGEELYRKAKEVGFTPVSVRGEGQTVGVAGVYLLGGGHSLLSSKYRLSIYQVLALQVVLANGTFMTVTEETDPDVFWALRGAGGSTFGIVTSVISAVYPQTGVTVSTSSFSTGPNVTADAFWDGFRTYLDHFPAHAEFGNQFTVNQR